MKYGEATMGQFEAVINKLGGMEGLKRFLAGELVVKSIFPIWKTIIIGGVSKEELLKRLKQNGIYVSDWAKDIMRKSAFKTSAEPHEISFIRVKVAGLGFTGFTEMPTTTELFARAKEQGLDLCEAEDGPHLRLALVNQPKGDWFWVAMESIIGSGGGPSVFCVGRHGAGERWLDADYTCPDDRWALVHELVFRFRK
jgi:hypothetical protein